MPDGTTRSYHPITSLLTQDKTFQLNTILPLFPLQQETPNGPFKICLLSPPSITAFLKSCVFWKQLEFIGPRPGSREAPSIPACTPVSLSLGLQSCRSSDEHLSPGRCPALTRSIHYHSGMGPFVTPGKEPVLVFKTHRKKKKKIMA